MKTENFNYNKNFQSNSKQRNCFLFKLILTIRNNFKILTTTERSSLFEHMKGKKNDSKLFNSIL